MPLSAGPPGYDRGVAIALGQLQNLIAQEYLPLAASLHLSPLPLDIYVVDESVGGRTTFLGTDMRNATPGYTPTHIVLPQLDGDRACWSATQPPFPPTCWNRHSDAWPAWRTELWHEVVHQYQPQILNRWDPNDGKGGHALGWPDAVAAVAKQFGLGTAQLLAVL